MPPLNIALEGDFDFLRIKPEGQPGYEESGHLRIHSTR